MILWIFPNIEEAMWFIRWKTPNKWDRIIILWRDQTTHERTGLERRNIKGIYIQGEKGENWLDWRNGKNAQEVNMWLLQNKIYETIKADQSFLKSIKWEEWKRGEKGEKGEDANIDLNYIIERLIVKLIDNKYFTEKCRWTNGKDGKDWYTPIKDEDYFDGKDGKPGKDWQGIDGADWWSVVFVEDPENVVLKDNQLWIDNNKNLYIKRNETILKI